MPQNPTPAFRERPPLPSHTDDGRGTPTSAGPSWGPLVFWGTLLVYEALPWTGIGLSPYLVVPTILVLLVVLAVRAKRSRGSRLAAVYLTAWPHAWRGVWSLLAVNCLFWAVAAPTLLMMLSVVVPGVPQGGDLVVLMLKVGALFLVLAALCFWFGFRGDRAAVAIVDAGAKAASAGTEVARRRFARRPQIPLGRWHRSRVSDVARVSALLGQPWDGLMLVAGWATFAVVAWIPMRPATETSPAVFFAGAAVCVAMTLMYAGVGRIYLRNRERQAVRRVFQPFLLGTALTLGMAALGIGTTLVYGPF